MKKRVYSKIFQKEVSKLKGKDFQNVSKKVNEILNNPDISHYKNLRNDLKKFKRVHVNNSYVILFFGDDGTVYFIDYAHHDTIYNHSRSKLNRYDDLFK